MIVLLTIMNVLPEKQKEVLQTLLSMVELPENEKGCLSYGISCDIEDNTVFNLISTWETRHASGQSYEVREIQRLAWNKEPLVRTVENTNLYGLGF